MSRNLKRVALNFSWPMNDVWKGYLNPYSKLSQDCEACDRSGYSPQAKRFHDQWYGKGPFDALGYGCSRVLTVDHPAIQALATYNVKRSPVHHMTNYEIMAETMAKRAAGVDLIEVTGGFGFKGAPLPSSDGGACSECGESDPHSHDMANFMSWTRYRKAAVQREAQRLLEWCFRDAWSHNLIQADVDALVADDRLWCFTRTPRDAGQAFVVAIRMAFHDTNSWLPEWNGYHPTADEVNDWSIGGFGHDGINHYVCLRARCEREGVTVECERCNGKGHYWQDISYDDLSYLTDGLISQHDMLAIAIGFAIENGGVTSDTKVPAAMIERLFEEWTDIEPPAGPGYQLWEDCSEGSPVSPVFTTLEALCAYAEKNCTTFADFKATKEEWHAMLDGGIVHHAEGKDVFV